MKHVLIRLWRGWKEIAGYFGDFQARLLLTVFYFAVLAPWGLVMRYGGDRLALRAHPSGSAWIARKGQRPVMEDARRQF